MNRKYEPGSEESINLIIESLRMAGIECRRVKEGEEGGIFYKDENGERKKFTDNIFIKRSMKYEQSPEKELTVPLSELNSEPIEQEPVSDDIESFHETLDINHQELVIDMLNNIHDIHPIKTTDQFHTFDPTVSKTLDAA